MFISLLLHNPAFYVMWVVLVAFSVCVHEYAHAWTAVRFGDYTPVRYGHLSLNPLRVMGVTSLIMLVLFGFAWGRVFVARGGLNRRRDILVSAAGPAANFGLFAVFTVLSAVLVRVTAGSGSPATAALLQPCIVGAQVNALLFIFNMLPIPILDGWSIYEGLFPVLSRLVSLQTRNEIGIAVLFVILVTPVGGYVWTLSSALASSALRVLT